MGKLSPQTSTKIKKITKERVNTDGWEKQLEHGLPLLTRKQRGRRLAKERQLVSWKENGHGNSVTARAKKHRARAA